MEYRGETIIEKSMEQLCLIQLYVDQVEKFHLKVKIDTFPM